MPRLSELRLSVLEDLAGQLRYAPKKRTIEQLRRAIALAPEIDAARLYPEDWLIQRITGYRPDLDEPAVIVGEALRRDLSAFTERVSDSAALTLDAIDMPTLPLEELEARWSVTGRTIERYRRAGLIALRVRDNGRTRLVFPMESVVAHERSHPRAITAAASITRLSVSERARLVRLADRARRRFGWSLNETARRIAERQHRSHEGVRQILLKAGGTRTSISRDDRRRRVAVRAWRRGVPVGRIAEKYGKSPATIRRILRQERAATLRESLAALGLDASRRAGEFDETALRPEAVRSGLQWPIATTAGEYVSLAHETAPPRREIEHALATARRSLAARIAEICPENATPPIRALDRAETDARWATRLVAKLVRMQWPFILKAIEARLGRSLLDLPAGPLRSIHEAAMTAASASAWRFDGAKGGRLAAITGIAVDRAVAGWIQAHAQDLPTSAGRARAVGATLSDWTLRLAPWQPWLEAPPALLRSFDDLADEERAVVEARWGLGGKAPMTIGEVAARMNVTDRRVGAIERAVRRRAPRTPPR